MNTFILTTGAHGSTRKKVPRGAHAAHVFDPDCLEDRAHQANWFLKNLAIRGPGEDPMVVMAAYVPDDDKDAALLDVDLSDFRSIVESATNRKMLIQ